MGLRRGQRTIPGVLPQPSVEETLGSAAGFGDIGVAPLGRHLTSASRLAFQTSMFGPRFLTPEQRGKVKDVTLERYRQAARNFTAWALPLALTPQVPEEWDDILVEYKHANPQVTRQ